MHSRKGIGVAMTALVGIVAVLATAVFFLYPGSNFLPNKEKASPLSSQVTDIPTNQIEQSPVNEGNQDMLQECSSLAIPEDQCNEQNLAAKKNEMFGSYSDNAQLSIHSLSITGSSSGDGSMEVVNSGGSSEAIVSIAIQGYGSALASTTPVNTHVFGGGGSGTSPTIPVDSEVTIGFIDLDDNGTTVPNLVSGQTVTVTITTQSGQQFTLSTTVV